MTKEIQNRDEQIKKQGEQIKTESERLTKEIQNRDEQIKNRIAKYFVDSVNCELAENDRFKFFDKIHDKYEANQLDASLRAVYEGELLKIDPNKRVLQTTSMTLMMNKTYVGKYFGNIIHQFQSPLDKNFLLGFLADNKATDDTLSFTLQRQPIKLTNIAFHLAN